jgi:hypothetical protein
MNQYSKAKKEGRICKNCGWIIPVKSWKAGERDYCPSCKDALRGVSLINYPGGRYAGHWQPRNEPIDPIEALG